MAFINLKHPVHIQHEDGRSIQLLAGDGVYVPDEYADHPRVVANAFFAEEDEKAEKSISDFPAFPADAATRDEIAMAEDQSSEPRRDDGAPGSEPSSKDELIAMAEELGLTIDKRWSAARIRAAIEAP